jgi:peroxiredoxin
MKVSAFVQAGFIGLAGLSVFAFVSMARDAETRRGCVPICVMRPNYAGQNRTAPDFELLDEHGAKVRLSQFRGKTVVLNFWTTTCQPCLEEMPSLADLTKVLRTRENVVVLTVSTDASKETADTTLQTLLQGKPPFAVLYDPEADVVRGKYGTSLYPETWVIDPRGVIRARFDGARDWTNAMFLDLLDSFARSPACGVEFQGGALTGDGEAMCDEAGAEG